MSQQEENDLTQMSNENSMILGTPKHVNNKNNSYQPSCLDSPSSIKSPNSLSTTFSSPSKSNEFPVIRKLGAAEVIYDYEHSNGNVILMDSFIITSKIDLYANLNSLNKSIFHWKQLNLLLRSSIYTVEPLSPVHSSPSNFTKKNLLFSPEKYFIFANEHKVELNENVKYYKLNLGSNKTNLKQESIEQICHEAFAREYNLEFVDTKNDLLWRLVFIETLNDNIKQEYNYYIIFTAHHAIADARNVHFIFTQLFDIIEKVYSSDSIINYEFCNHYEPSIEERLYDNDPIKLSKINVKENENFIGDTCKLINELAKDLHNEPFKRFCDLNLNEIKFESIDSSNKSFTLNDILNDTNIIIKVRNFMLHDEFKILVNKCKQNNVKITGCINLITAIATRKLYNKFTSNKDLLNIHYHLLANLRPFLNPPLNNFIMGYWAIVFSLNFDKEINLNDNDFWLNDFWKFAKNESDSLHEKLKNNEHFEMAKFDTLLLDLILHGQHFPNGGGVHYALSNLGIMPSSINNESKIKIKSHFFGTTLQPNRWSSCIFHAITTINNGICWSITYNSKLFSDNIVDNLVENIFEIIQKLISNSNL